MNGNGVYIPMRLIARTLMLCGFFFCMGCASAPTPAPTPVMPWPASVAETCPKRTVLLECFRRDAIKNAMMSLVEKFGDCARPGSESVLVKMKIETQAGKATCVDRSPRNNETAHCIAKVVARHLLIPGSPKDERCDFKYPVRFESSENKESTEPN